MIATFAPQLFIMALVSGGMLATGIRFGIPSFLIAGSATACVTLGLTVWFIRRLLRERGWFYRGVHRG